MILPDPEKLLIEALRSISAIATPAGNRIGTRLRGTYPAIRVTLLGGPPRPFENTGQPEFQVECCGDGTDPAHEIQANDLARAVEGSIPDLVGVHPSGHIVAAYGIGGILHTPMGDTNRERYIVQVGLVVQ